MNTVNRCTRLIDVIIYKHGESTRTRNVNLDNIAADLGGGLKGFFHRSLAVAQQVERMSSLDTNQTGELEATTLKEDLESLSLSHRSSATHDGERTG